MEKSKELSTSKKWIFSILIIILPFIIGEVAIRMMMDSNTVLNVNLGGHKEYHPERKTQLTKNYSSNTFSINSKGILGPEIQTEKNDSTLRVLSIGDSVTFSPAEKNYSKCLEISLNDHLGQDKVEVIAGAVGGYTSFDALNWYDEYLHELQPDIALVYLGWNDLGQYHPFGLKYKNEHGYQKETMMTKLFSNIYLLRIGYFLQGRAEKSKPADTSDLTNEERTVIDAFYPDHYEKNLTELITKLQASGTEVYLISLTGLVSLDEPKKVDLEKMHFLRNINKKFTIYKELHKKYVTALNSVSSSLDVPIINLDKFLADDIRDDLFTDTMHITPKGAEEYGKEIAKHLLAEIDKKKTTNQELEVL